MPELVRDHRVLAVDLRGMGASSRPAGGYDKKTMSGDIRRIMVRLGIRSASVLGHDIGAQVAFSLAANHPEAVDKLVLVDFVHFSPEWYTLPLLPGPGTFVDQSQPGPGGSYLWWFAFHQVKGLPEQLLGDRAYLEQEWFFNYVSLNSASITDFDRAVYAAAYPDADAVRAGNAWFQSLDQDVEDYLTYEALRMPVLGLGSGVHELMSTVLPQKITDLDMVKVPASGHFPVDENPNFVLQELTRFLSRP
jgi:pimeloyl-ACP methyl ester carboxylesterase